MLTSSDLFMSGLGNRSCGQARCMLFRLLVLVALICTAFVLQPAALQAAEDEYPHCISHLWAAGSQLGWAEAIARHDAQSEDARMLEHMHDAGLHVERANELCAQDPAPWPAWPNWREIQHQLTGMADQFHDGRMNRERLAIAHTHLERDATCVEIYVRLGAAVGFAQTTTQIFHRLAPDAAVSLRRALSLIYQMREMPQPCRDFKGLIPAIGEALNSPNDPSIVGRVDDIWHAGEIAAAPRTE
jgi:hypothetical protein